MSFDFPFYQFFLFTSLPMGTTNQYAFNLLFNFYWYLKSHEYPVHYVFLKKKKFYRINRFKKKKGRTKYVFFSDGQSSFCWGAIEDSPSESWNLLVFAKQISRNTDIQKIYLNQHPQWYDFSYTKEIGIGRWLSRKNLFFNIKWNLLIGVTREIS